MTTPLSFEDFFADYKKCIDVILEDEILIGADGDIDNLPCGTFTYAFNLAIYAVAKKHSLSLRPENPIGRGGYSDVLLLSRDGQSQLVEIEHENSPKARRNGKSAFSALQNSLTKLMKSQASLKIIITYTKNCTEKELISSSESFLRKRNFNGPIYLIYAPEDMHDAKEYTSVILNVHNCQRQTAQPT